MMHTSGRMQSTARPCDFSDSLMNSNDIKARNFRTAAILFSIALTFFVGIIVAQAFGTPVVTVAVVGGAVLLFLSLGIGRHLRNPGDRNS